MRRLLGILLCLLVACTVAFAGNAPGPADPVSEYVAVRSQQDVTPYSVEVTITAALPSMRKVGKLHAVRHQADGRFTYDSMRFEGDNMIKTNVIARYLTAEFQAQRPEEKLATQISPANYEFKLKGHDQINGREVLVYQVKPRKKRAGLFKGTIWIDSITGEPVQESGKLTKLPSIWLKAITFKRLYSLVDGRSVPARIVSDVATRIVGKAHIEVSFDNYRFGDSSVAAIGAAPSTIAASGDSASGMSDMLSQPQ